MSLSNFHEQSVWLILLINLDTAVGKHSGNNEHKNFYVENFVPNQGKNHDLPPVGFSLFTITRKLGYNATHPVTSNSHANV